MNVESRIARVELPTAERPPSGAPLDGIERIVVVRADRLGDLMVSLPAIAAIRRAYPDAQLTLLLREPWLRLATMIDGVDRLVPAGPRLRDLVENVRGADAQAIVCLSREGATALAARLAGIEHRVGTGRRAWSWCFTRRVVVSRRAARMHEADHALETARRSGAGIAAGTPRFGLTLDDEARERAAAWCAAHGLTERGYVLFHPGSGGSCPRWPARHFVELARRLAHDGRRVVVSLGPDDAAARERFADPVHGAIRFDGDLVTLAGLAASAAAAVGNSSGPLHLAAALGTPTLTIHAPWPSCDAVRWGPYAANGLALVAESPNAIGWSRARRRSDAPALMAALSPDDVQAALSRLGV